jgi:hypothetical protein
LSASATSLRKCPAERFLAQEWLVGNHSCARSYAVTDERAVGSKDDVERRKSGERPSSRSAELTRQ